MTSPIEEIEIECPQCQFRFKTSYRASLNLQLDNFDRQYIEQMSTAICPGCKQQISLDSLVVEKNGVWTKGSPSRREKSQVTGNVGLYYVCYRLSLLGWNAMPTSRNAKGIDIIAYNRNCTKTIALQVKTLSKRVPVPLGNSINNFMGDFWIIVNDVEKVPCIYVMTPKEVGERAHRGEKDCKVSYWLQPKAYEIDEFRDKYGNGLESHNRHSDGTAGLSSPGKKSGQ